MAYSSNCHNSEDLANLVSNFLMLATKIFLEELYSTIEVYASILKNTSTPKATDSVEFLIAGLAWRGKLVQDSHLMVEVCHTKGQNRRDTIVTLGLTMPKSLSYLNGVEKRHAATSSRIQRHVGESDTRHTRVGSGNAMMTSCGCIIMQL